MLYQVDCASVIREQYRQVTLQAVPRSAHSPRAKLTNIDDVDPELYVQPICPGVTNHTGDGNASMGLFLYYSLKR